MNDQDRQCWRCGEPLLDCESGVLCSSGCSDIDRFAKEELGDPDDFSVSLIRARIAHPERRVN